jgi:glycosyltransferase involved in cell wall biosynthesis
MRIGVLAPISHPFPPTGYGPWERVAFEEVEGLTELGHDVTLFAAAGATSSAKEHIVTADAPIGEGNEDPRLAEEFHISYAMRMAGEGAFDVLHSHLHVHALGYAPLLPCPLISTLHGAAWNTAHHRILEGHKHEPFVSISDAERNFLPQLNYVATVYNGINISDFDLRADKDDYLLFAGRIAPEKAPDIAVEVARRSGHRLLIAGGVEEKHRGFFEERIAPEIGNGIEFLGGQSRAALIDLLAGARGLLMPLRWDEPFGLVVVEALATGTPVIGWRRGALPELIEDGRHGFLVDEVDDALKAVSRLHEIDPGVTRAHVERNFSRHAMAAGYAGVFQSLL